MRMDFFQKLPWKLEGLNVFDALYSGITLGLVETLGRMGRVLPANRQYKRGERLQILFLAYSGARNTGAEVRVGECIRQVNQVLGHDRVDINMTTLDLKEASEYFKGYRVNLKPLNAVFFGDVYRYALENHMIVLVEGSCWKENFATALLLYFLYGAGLAARLNKPCFSYAVDAGEMNILNNWLSYYLSRDMTRIITRSEDSKHVLERIGLRVSSVRVDTAWSQEAAPLEWALELLEERGWDGRSPVVGLAMQNFHRWPVVPDLARYLKSLLTGDRRNQYKLVYFYDYSAEDEAAYQKWASMLARVMDTIAERHRAQPVLIAMEALDDDSCRDVEALMRHRPIVLSCKEFVGTQMAALLRTLSLLITTRYHAMVLSMPGKVPFIGLSRDERIRGVMKEIGLYDDYYLDYRSDGLEQALLSRAERILSDATESARLRRIITEHLPYYYAQMAMLGLDIRRLVREAFPDFEPTPLDEDDALELVPYVPKQLVEQVRRKYLELKAKE